MSNEQEGVRLADPGAGVGDVADITAQNKAVLRRFQQEVFNGHDWRIETLAKYLTPDFVDHSTESATSPTLEGFARRWADWQAAFGNAYKQNIAVLGEGDLVAVLSDVHARHTGEFAGIPASQRQVVIPGLEIMRFTDGKISHYWSIYDYLNTATEIGAMLTLVPRTPPGVTAPPVSQDTYRGIAHEERKRHNVFVDPGRTDAVARNKAVLRRFQQEVFNGHDWRIETLAKHLTADFVDHAAGPWDQPGLEGVSQRFSAWQQAFDDAEEDNIAMVGEGDMLAVLYDLHATHRGDFLGIPASHEHVIIPGIELLRFRDDKIAEHWGIYDFVSTAEQVHAHLVFVPRPQDGDPRQASGAHGQDSPHSLETPGPTQPAG